MKKAMVEINATPAVQHVDSVIEGIMAILGAPHVGDETKRRALDVLNAAAATAPVSIVGSSFQSGER